VEIHKSLFDKALAFRRANTHETTTYDELKKAVESGFAFALWCGSGDCEAKIKEETRATMRCIPIDQTAVLGKEVKRAALAYIAGNRQRIGPSSGGLTKPVRKDNREPARPIRCI